MQLMSVWHGMRVGKYRRAAGIPYPHSYASMEQMSAASTTAEKKAAMYEFNCAQRAHHNFLENSTIAMSGLLLAGIQYPVASASLGAMWLVSRAAYAIGYVNRKKENGQGRFAGGLGMLFWLAQLGWVGIVGKQAWDLIMV